MIQGQIKERIDSVINNIDQLPSIPEVATKIINMVNNPDIPFKQVADEIARNQAMTTNVLKLANSAFFSKGKEITSIERAIVTLGLKEVKNIVLVIAAKPILDKAITGYDIAKGDLWRQGLVVATLSKEIALAIKRKDISDVVFTGGIIHNVGKVVLALFVQNSLKDILALVQSKGISFSAAELEVMGYNHQQIGEKILAKWNFPPVLKSIVRSYHEPFNAPVEHRMEVSIVHIANAVSLMAGIGIGSDGLYHEIKDDAVKTVGLPISDIENLYGNMPEILKKVAEIPV